MKELFEQRRTQVFRLCFIPMLLLLAVQPSFAADRDHLNLSLEELMELEVTGLSKQKDTFAALPAAAYVITEQEIAYSTATNIPELLKMVPGIQVAQLNSGRYAVSSRGFNALFSNKLLVLLDGKTAYSSLFSSTYWDALDLPLYDIERIEVYRSPVGVTYGSNAVNGIIHIMTKKPEETQGAAASAAAGDYERVIASTRYGGALSDSYHYRVSAKYRNRDTVEIGGDESDADTGYENYHFSFRLDGEVSPDTSTSTSLHFSHSRIRDSFLFDTPGALLPAATPTEVDEQFDFLVSQRVNHVLSDEVTLDGQLSFDREDRENLDTNAMVNTAQIEGRAIWDATDRIELVGGASYRYVGTDLNNGEVLNVSFEDHSPSLTVAGIFSEVEYRPAEQVKLLAGVRAEYNDYTDIEWMPNVRLGFYPSDGHTLWASVGRSTRLPSIIDENGRAQRFSNQSDPATGLPILVNFMTPGRSEAETVWSYETGYRGELSENISLDLSLFFNDYSDLQAVSSAGTPTPIFSPIPAIAVPAVFDYNAEGETWGGEFGVRFNISQEHYIYTSYSYLNFQTSGLGEIASAFNAGGADAENKVTLHLHTTPLRHLELDLFYYFVDELARFESVGSYHQFDARVSLELNEDWRMSFIGRNLLESEHREWGNDEVLELRSGEIPRSFFGLIEYSLG